MKLIRDSDFKPIVLSGCRKRNWDHFGTNSTGHRSDGKGAGLVGERTLDIGTGNEVIPEAGA